VIGSGIISTLIASLITAGIAAYVWLFGRKETFLDNEGWSCIFSGFVLIFFGGVVDITNNVFSFFQFEGQSYFSIFSPGGIAPGKVFGFFFGSLMLSIGFFKRSAYFPTLKKTQDELESTAEKYNARLIDTK